MDTDTTPFIAPRRNLVTHQNRAPVECRDETHSGTLLLCINESSTYSGTRVFAHKPLNNDSSKTQRSTVWALISSTSLSWSCTPPCRGVCVLLHTADCSGSLLHQCHAFHIRAKLRSASDSRHVSPDTPGFIHCSFLQLNTRRRALAKGRCQP